VETHTHRSLRLWLALLLAISTLAAYWRVSGFDFVDYDDQDYVQENPHVYSGLTPANLRWAFTEVHAANWHPLTWISHMVDCQLFGLNARAHHVVNLLLHIANTLVLFELLRFMTGATWRSAIVAGLFALHPAHVESVAWISERKDVLSTLFALLATLLYARAARAVDRTATNPAAPGDVHPDRLLGLRDFWPGLVCYALSLLSKGMYVTLPCLLLLLDLWPLRRMSADTTWAERGRHCLRLAWEKWPWFLLAVLVSGATFWAQKTGGAVVAVSQFPFSDRLSNALITYIRYLGKMVWPADLTLMYPLPAVWPAWQVAGAVIVLLLLTAATVLAIRKHPCCFIGWAWYAGTLVPVIGLVQVGSQAMADRYTYFSFIGLFIAVVWLAGDALARRPQWRPVLAGMAALILIACAVTTRRQVEFWSSSRALFERAVAVTGDNAQAQFHLGALSESENRLGEAVQHYSEAVRIVPSNPGFRTSLGVLIARTGDTNAARVQLGQAMDAYLEIIRKRPDFAAGYNGIGIALSALGEFSDAVEVYNRAVRLKPRDPVYRNNLGVALAQIGDLSGAIAEHREALRLNPQHAGAASNLGAELVSAGRLDEGLPLLEQAVRLDPTSAEARSNLGGALARKGDHSSAIIHYEIALQHDPLQAKTHLNLGLSLTRLGRLVEAEAQYLEAIRLEPGNLDARYNLGRNALLQGNASQAETQLTAVVQADPGHASAHFQLGQACARLHRTDQALAHFREAIQLRANWPEALAAMAWILATDPDARYRNGAESVKLIEPAASVTDARQPRILDVLAAAYAEAGRFEDAATTARRAADSARRFGQTNLAVEINQRLLLYDSHQPFRSSVPAK